MWKGRIAETIGVITLCGKDYITTKCSRTAAIVLLTRVLLSADLERYTRENMNTDREKRILGPDGSPIPKPPDWKKGLLEKLKSTKKRNLISFITVGCLMVALVANIGTIKSTFFSEQKDNNETQVTVPDMYVVLRNSGLDPILFPKRGEYWLFALSTRFQPYSGGYQLIHIDGSELSSEIVELLPDEEQEFLVHFSNPGLAEYLETGDYFVELIFRTDQDDQNMVWSQSIPFIEEELLNHVYEIDVFENYEGNANLGG